MLTPSSWSCSRGDGRERERHRHNPALKGFIEHQRRKKPNKNDDAVW